MKTMIIIGALIFAWLIISQLIAWVMTASKDEDEVLETWGAVFLLPALLLVALTMGAERKFYRLAERFGFTWRI